MLILQHRLVTYFLIVLIQIGLFSSLSPAQDEESKVITYHEWLNQQTDETNQKNNEDDSATVETIKQDSWSDFHKSQTSKNVVLKTDHISKLVNSGFSFSGSASTFQKIKNYRFITSLHAEIIVNRSEKPFLSGVAIGAP